jgi:hypothetical protein
MCKATFRIPWIAFFLVVILSLACSSQVSVLETVEPPNVETLVAGTLVVLTQTAPTATNTFVPTATSIPASPTPEKFGEVYVYTTTDNVNLRTNPGMLFTVSRVMAQNTRLRLLGKAPGGEWLNVMNDEGIAGWVYTIVVSMTYDGPPPPVIEPTNVLLVTGNLVTELGTPVNGVGFAVQQGSRRTDAVTDADGRFFVYLPPTMSGTWTVGYASISCTSNTMDVNCNCIGNRCGTADPVSVSVQLPQTEPLKFVWR